MSEDIPEWAVEIRERLARIEAILEAGGVSVRTKVTVPALGAGVGGIVFAILEAVRIYAESGM